MVEDLIKRIAEQCSGRDRWYVMNEAEDGYCMDFGHQLDADRWMADRMRENPDYIKRNGYHIVKQRSFTPAEALANEAAARLTALESERDALLAAAGKEAVAGWSLVPVEPTPEMVLKGGVISLGKPLNERSVKTIYSAMLSVAPTAAPEKGDGRDAEWLAEVCEDADGTKHIEAAVEELDDIPTGTRLYAGTHMAWRPIETAPKDGTWILMTNGVDVAGGQWIRDEGGTTEYRDEDGRYLGQDDRDDFEGWMDWMGGIPSPTHWSPLPAPPAALSQKAGEPQ